MCHAPPPPRGRRGPVRRRLLRDSAAANVRPVGTSTSAAGAPASGSCRLLSHDEVKALLGGEPGPAQPRQLQGLSACRWSGGDKYELQVMEGSAAAWAKSLPATLEQLERSGLIKDAENKRKFAIAADLVRQGKDIPPAEACTLFSAMLEVRGQEPGSLETVSVIPSSEEPIAVSGQSCRDGRFTSVTIAREAGLEADPFADPILTALDAAHARAIEG